MRLTVQTDYSLRMLVYLAATPDRLVSVSEIAEAFQISRNHLVKIAHRLGQLGYLETTRGRGGGLRLGLVPARINIGEVVQKIEPDFDLVECFDCDRSQCVITHGCALKGPLYEAQRAFLAVLRQYSLADLMSRPDFRAQLVRLRP